MNKARSSRSDSATETDLSPVTAWHLASTPLEAATTELEWALLRWHEAFARYSIHILNMLGVQGITASESALLHIIGLHNRPKNANMIAKLLNRDDIQNVQYSLRKLLAAGLIEKAKDSSGKNANLMVTAKGRQLCDDFASTRRELLITQISQLENGESRLMYSAKIISLLTGLYDEAGRTSTAYRMHPAVSPE